MSERAILERLTSQRYRCALTGRKLTPKTATVDHKVPVARGGAHDARNIWLLHHDVNRAKGTMTIDEFITLCGEVVGHSSGRKRCPAAPAPAVSAESQLTLFDTGHRLPRPRRRMPSRVNAASPP